MNTCITKFFQLPIQYISETKKLKLNQILLKDTKYFPAYPIMIIVCLALNLALEGYIMDYFFTSPTHSCYNDIRFGVEALACVYPIYTIVIFVCLLGIVGNSKYEFWKIFIITFFGIFTTAFGFGGLGVVYICMEHTLEPNVIPSSFLTQNYFIQIVVYAMLSFIALYALFVPPIAYCHNKRDPQKDPTACDNIICFFHYFFQILLFIATIFLFVLLLAGIPILFYLLYGIGKMTKTDQNIFFGLAVTCLVAPIGVFLSVYIFQQFFGCGQVQELNVNQGAEEKNIDNPQANQGIITQKESNIQKQQATNNEENSTRRTILLQDYKHKDFGDDQNNAQNYNNYRNSKL